MDEIQANFIWKMLKDIKNGIKKKKKIAEKYDKEIKNSKYKIKKDYITKKDLIFYLYIIKSKYKIG